jgi:hypothetical protein
VQKHINGETLDAELQLDKWGGSGEVSVRLNSEAKPQAQFLKETGK